MRFVFLLFFVFLNLNFVFSQQKVSTIKGKTINGFTKDIMPFTSISWKNAGFGVVSDSAGNFLLQYSTFINDTIVATYIGYENVFFPFNPKRDTGLIQITIQDIKTTNDVVLKSKFNKGLRWWKNIVTHKPENNPYKFLAYSCELYNKLELDINNVTKNSFQTIKMLQPFLFLLDNIDSVSEQRPFLPIFMTESLADYFYKTNPLKSREVIKAVQTHGIKNESVLQFVSGVNQKINLYQDQVKLFGKEFISPISSNADKYYFFKGADTQTINQEKYFHLFFKPLREGENCFVGDFWIHSTSWAIQKANLSVPSSADINFVNRMTIIQEFAKMPNGYWIFAKDKVVIDLSPFKKNKLTFIARKTTTYNHLNLDIETIETALALNKKSEESVVIEESQEKDKSFWETNRHEPLNNNEKKIFKMIDTLKTIPLFKKYARDVEFLVDGYRKFGKVEIGPWTKWFSGNQLEGLRLRFDLGTTDKFSKNLRLNTYIAYGTKDAIWKGKLAANYKIPGTKGLSVYASHTQDLDNGRIRYSEDDATIDNVFNQLLRRKGIPQKFLDIKETKFIITKEFDNNLTTALALNTTDYDTKNPLPRRRNFSNGRNALLNTELMLRIRYAPGEKKISNHRKNLRFKGNAPIYELRLAKGFKDVLDGGHDYVKYNVSLTHKFRIPQWGQINYNIYGGRIFDKDSIPFVLLEIHPGNEFYTYNRNGFNLMNRFENFSDKYIGFQVEHNLEKKLLNLLPFMRKSKIRQFWNIKGVWGDLNNKNRRFNRTEFVDYQLRSLRGHTYLEFGTGFDNIFRFFRIDLVWRKSVPDVGYNRLQPTQDFGVFGSLRVQF